MPGRPRRTRPHVVGTLHDSSGNPLPVVCGKESTNLDDVLVSLVSLGSANHATRPVWERPVELNIEGGAVWGANQTSSRVRIKSGSRPEPGVRESQGPAGDLLPAQLRPAGTTV